jgi:hypothetical protein
MKQYRVMKMKVRIRESYVQNIHPIACFEGKRHDGEHLILNRYLRFDVEKSDVPVWLMHTAAEVDAKNRYIIDTRWSSQNQCRYALNMIMRLKSLYEICWVDRRKYTCGTAHFISSAFRYVKVLATQIDVVAGRACCSLDARLPRYVLVHHR